MDERDEQGTRELVDLVDVVDHDDPATTCVDLLERGTGPVEEQRAIQLAFGAARPGDLRRQQVCQRGERQALRLRMASDPGDRQARFRGQPQALVGKPRLADAGAAGDEDAAGAGILERGGDRLDLVRAAEQRPRHRGHDVVRRRREHVHRRRRRQRPGAGASTTALSDGTVSGDTLTGENASSSSSTVAANR